VLISLQLAKLEERLERLEAVLGQSSERAVSYIANSHHLHKPKAQICFSALHIKKNMKKKIVVIFARQSSSAPHVI
jgi:hypothetical protein